jgi:hypothetical protein
VSCRPRCVTFAARSAEPRRYIRQWRFGEAVPGDGAASRRPPSNLLAADARVLFPIARAASRGLAQPGFNEVAPCVASSAAGAARPHRNLYVIKSNTAPQMGRGDWPKMVRLRNDHQATDAGIGRAFRLSATTPLPALSRTDHPVSGSTRGGSAAVDSQALVMRNING